MPRYKLTLEYDGREFVGWQRQDNGPSVQAALEDAIMRFAGESVTVQGAGRTDAGVHALGQVAHVNLAKPRSLREVRDAVNQHLKPAPIAVLAAERTGADFHARFSATKRHYLYRLINRRGPLTLGRGRAWRVPVPLDAARMQRAAQLLVGRHDFSTFRASQCQAASPVKCLHRLDVEQEGEEIRFHAEARSFLQHQVRSMVGSLKRVGEGKWGETDLAEALAARDRRRCGPVAPPDGLYLVRVLYTGE